MELLFYLACMFGAGITVGLILLIGSAIFGKLSDVGKGLLIIIAIACVVISLVYNWFFTKPQNVLEWQADQEEEQYRNYGHGRF